MDCDLKLSDWLKKRQISKFTLAKMKAEGTAPKVFFLGPRTKIGTVEADRDWREAHTTTAVPISQEAREQGRLMHAHSPAGRKAAAVLEKS